LPGLLIFIGALFYTTQGLFLELSNFESPPAKPGVYLRKISTFHLEYLSSLVSSGVITVFPFYQELKAFDKLDRVAANPVGGQGGRKGEKT
jgi:hypothetical protein